MQSKKRVAAAENGDVAPAKRGRGRPPKKEKVGAKKDTAPKSKGASKGRGRPAKAAPKKKVESEEEEDNAESGEEEESS